MGHVRNHDRDEGRLTQIPHRPCARDARGAETLLVTGHLRGGQRSCGVRLLCSGSLFRRRLAILEAVRPTTSCVVVFIAVVVEACGVHVFYLGLAADGVDKLYGVLLPILRRWVFGAKDREQHRPNEADDPEDVEDGGPVPRDHRRRNECDDGADGLPRR